MGRMWIAGLGVVAVLVLGAAGAPGASAAGPEFKICARAEPTNTGRYSGSGCSSREIEQQGHGAYERVDWERAHTRAFEGEGDEPSLNIVDPTCPNGDANVIAHKCEPAAAGKATASEPAGITDVTDCAAEHVVGEVTGPKEERWHTTYTGCEEAGTPCQTTGANQGEIKTEELEGTLVTLNPAETEVGTRVRGVDDDGVIAQYECEAGALKVEVGGELLEKRQGDIEEASKTFGAFASEGPLRLQSNTYAGVEAAQTEEDAKAFFIWAGKFEACYDEQIGSGHSESEAEDICIFGIVGPPPASEPVSLFNDVTGAAEADEVMVQNSDTEVTGEAFLVEKGGGGSGRTNITTNISKCEFKNSPSRGELCAIGIKNLGPEQVTITNEAVPRGAAKGSFKLLGAGCTGKQLAANQSCTTQLEYVEPQVEARLKAEFVVEAKTVGSGEVREHAVELEVVPSPPEIVASPPKCQFTNYLPPIRRPCVVVIRNVGPEEAKITAEAFEPSFRAVPGHSCIGKTLGYKGQVQPAPSETCTAQVEYGEPQIRGNTLVPEGFKVTAENPVGGQEDKATINMEITPTEPKIVALAAGGLCEFHNPARGQKCQIEVRNEGREEVKITEEDVGLRSHGAYKVVAGKSCEGKELAYEGQRGTANKQACMTEIEYGAPELAAPSTDDVEYRGESPVTFEPAKATMTLELGFSEEPKKRKEEEKKKKEAEKKKKAEETKKKKEEEKKKKEAEKKKKAEEAKKKKEEAKKKKEQEKKKKEEEKKKKKEEKGKK